MVYGKGLLNPKQDLLCQHMVWNLFLPCLPKVFRFLLPYPEELDLESWTYEVGVYTIR